MRYYIEDLKNHIGEKIELKGWVYNTRSSGKVKFLEIRDGTGIVPCIFFRGECQEEALTTFDQLTQEMSVKVTGTVRKHPKHEGVFEIGGQAQKAKFKLPSLTLSPKLITTGKDPIELELYFKDLDRGGDFSFSLENEDLSHRGTRPKK